MKIIHKYVLREHVGPLVFCLSALTSLLLLNYIAKRFGELVGKGLPSRIIAEFVFLSVPFTFAMTLPMSILIATLYAFSRLAAENEITALKANGVSMVRLLVPVLIAASFISLGMVAFNDAVLPRANHQLRTLQGDIARKKPTFSLREQILNEMPGGIFLRTIHLDPYTGQMREVTIYDLSDPLRRRTVYADSGEMAFAPNGNDLLLTLRHGYMLEVPKETPAQLQRLQFERDYVLVKGIANQLEVTADDSYKSDREMSICELQNEVSRNESDVDSAEVTLRRALQAASRQALTGLASNPVPVAPASIPTVLGAPAPRSRHFTLGRVYCDVTSRLQRIKLPKFALMRTAQATELASAQAAQRADTAQSKPDNARARADSIARADSARSDSVRRDSVRRADSAAVARAVPAPVVTPAIMPAAATSMPYLVSGQIEISRVRIIDGRRQMNQYSVELHKKIAISVACVVFVLIGAPIALRFPRGGVGLVIGVSLTVFAIYYVGLIAGEALADRTILTPFWAMWSANILFTVVGIILLARMGRESATSRGGDIHELVEIVRGWGRTLTFRRHEDRMTQAEGARATSV